MPHPTATSACLDQALTAAMVRYRERNPASAPQLEHAAEVNPKKPVTRNTMRERMA